MKPRRQTKLSERLTPCECCNYPISQRHHLLEVSFWGENDMTAQLCANCHELFHLCSNIYQPNGEQKPNQVDEYKNPLTRSMRLWGEMHLHSQYIDIVRWIRAKVLDIKTTEWQLTKQILQKVNN